MGKKAIIVAAVMVVCMMLCGLPAQASLMALWRFDEGSGTTAEDSSGNGNDGSLYCNIWEVDDYVPTEDPLYLPSYVASLDVAHGTALQFNPSYNETWGEVTPYSMPGVWVETDPGAARPHDANLNLTGSFTVAMWIWCEDDGSGHPNAPNYATLINRANAYQFQTPKTGADPSFYVWYASTWTGLADGLDTDAPLSSETWMHLAFVYDLPTKTLKLYINGVENDSRVQPHAGWGGSTSFYASPWDLAIGGDILGSSNNWLRAFSGKMDDVAMFDEALTPEQLETIMEGDFSAWPYTAPPVEPQDKGDLLGLWRFDEGSGYVAADSSAYGNSGLLGAMTRDMDIAPDVPSEGADAIASPDWVSGKYGTALHFHGEDAEEPWARPFVHVPYSTTLDVTDEFTLAAWVYLDEPSSGQLLYQHVICGASSYRLELPAMESADPLSYTDPNFWVEASNWASGAFSEGLFAVNTGTPSASFLAGQWKHVAVTLSGGTLTAYVDGQVTDTNTGVTATMLPNSPRGLFIGHNATSPWGTVGGTWNDVLGKLDDVAIFKRALSPSEIQGIMGGDFSDYVPSQGPGVIVASLASGFIEEGRMLTLTAPEGGVSYQWRFNGAPMSDTEDERITGTDSRFLVFDPVMLDDAGTYTCVYDDGSKEFIETPAFELTVLAAGTLPVAGVVGGLGLLAALAAWGAAVIKRRR